MVSIQDEIVSELKTKKNSEKDSLNGSYYSDCPFCKKEAKQKAFNFNPYPKEGKSNTGVFNCRACGSKGTGFSLYKTLFGSEFKPDTWENQKVSFYTDLYKTNPVNVPILDILRDIKEGKYKSQIEAIRNEPDSKKRAKKKNSLSGFRVSGIFSGNTDESLLSHSGLIQIDIDKNSSEELRKSLENDLYSFTVFQSPSGDGIKLIVKIPTIAHKESFLALANYYKESYGIEIDEQCKNVSRFFFVSYDPNLYLNKDSLIFSEIVSDYSQNKEPDSFMDKFYLCSEEHKRKEFFRALDMIPEKVKDDKKRNLYYGLIVSVQTKYGDTKARIFAERVFRNSSQLDQIDTILNLKLKNDSPNLVFSYAYNFGFKLSLEKSTKQKPDTDKQIETEPKEKKVNIYAKIRSYLNSNYDFKYNTIRGNYYYKRKAENDFLEVNDKVPNNILQELSDFGIDCSKDKLITAIESNYISTDFDPFKDYFEKRELESDPFDCYIENFYEQITGKKVSENKNEFESVKTWFASAVGLALGDMVRTNYVLVFQGGQSTGKTSLFHYLTPPQLREYTVSNLTDYESKDTKIALAENFLINLDELGESGKHELKKLKSLVTQSTIKERRSYGRFSEFSKRRASFIGSFDKDEVFDDTAGNRRFITIQIKKIDWKEMENIPVDGIWRQAIYLYRNNDYSKSIDSFNTEKNKQFEVSFYELELLIMYQSELSSLGKAMTTEIALRLENLTERKISTHKLGQALSKLKIERKSYQEKGNNKCYDLSKLKEAIEKYNSGS